MRALKQKKIRETNNSPCDHRHKTQELIRTLIPNQWLVPTDLNRTATNFDIPQSVFFLRSRCLASCTFYNTSQYQSRTQFNIGIIHTHTRTHAHTHTHDGLSRRGRRIPTSSVRLAMGKQTNARGAWSATDVASPHHRPSCSNRVLPGLPLGDKSCCAPLLESRYGI